MISRVAVLSSTVRNPARASASSTSLWSGRRCAPAAGPAAAPAARQGVPAHDHAPGPRLHDGRALAAAVLRQRQSRVQQGEAHRRVQPPDVRAEPVGRRAGRGERPAVAGEVEQPQDGVARGGHGQCPVRGHGAVAQLQQGVEARAVAAGDVAQVQVEAVPRLQGGEQGAAQLRRGPRVELADEHGLGACGAVRTEQDSQARMGLVLPGEFGSRGNGVHPQIGRSVRHAVPPALSLRAGACAASAWE